MKILLVEDELHKKTDLLQCISNVFITDVKEVDNVSSAVQEVMETAYDLIVLDMALPTFGNKVSDNKKGHDQAQGGVEVLRALHYSEKTPHIIIVTQYPDFYIAGKKVKLKDSANVIKEKYQQNIIGAILYTYNSNEMLQKITSILEKIK